MNLNKRLNESIDNLHSFTLEEGQDGFVIVLGDDMFLTSMDNDGRMWGTSCSDVTPDTEALSFKSEEAAKEALRKDIEIKGDNFEEQMKYYEIVPYSVWEQKKAEFLDYYGNKDSDMNGKYVIQYGRGDIKTFKTLKAAKQWQVDNIWSEYVDSDDSEEVPVKYKWERADESSALEFCMYYKDGSKVDIDPSDGTGWFIETNED